MLRRPWVWRVVLALFAASAVGHAALANKVKGITLTEIGHHVYDAWEGMGPKTEAQYIIDRLYDLGIRHINLSPRAVMRDPRGSTIEPITPEHEVTNERERYRRLIRYIHSRGMTVGIRPIFFVVDAWGNTPLVEPLPGGG